jgi:hypothetical protein
VRGKTESSRKGGLRDSAPPSTAAAEEEDIGESNDPRGAACRQPQRSRWGFELRPGGLTLEARGGRRGRSATWTTCEGEGGGRGMERAGAGVLLRAR